MDSGHQLPQFGIVVHGACGRKVKGLLAALKGPLLIFRIRYGLIVIAGAFIVQPDLVFMCGNGAGYVDGVIVHQVLARVQVIWDSFDGGNVDQIPLAYLADFLPHSENALSPGDQIELMAVLLACLAAIPSGEIPAPAAVAKIGDQKQVF